MKQVIVVDESLALPRGKLAAQVAHASISAFLNSSTQAQSDWLAEGMPKVVLACASETELIQIHAQAIDKGLPAELIRDAGLTVIPADTLTCVGIGPADEVSIDSIIGSFKLVR